MEPLCYAPFNSILIDVDKSVKPCCIWHGKPYGNLNDQDINTILNSDYVKQIKTDMINNVWNEGCLNCKFREEETGTSPRLNVYRNEDFKNIKVGYADKKIKYLEYNSTNTCNLACIMCTPSWSSNLYEFNKHYNIKDNSKFVNNNIPKWGIHPINQHIATNFVESLDLSELKTVWFKGGEPFLNKEVITILSHLKKINQLDKVKVWITSNGTIVNENIFKLLDECEHVNITLSIDGTDRINRYIRYGFGNPKINSIENIITNIKKLIQLPNVKVLTSPTVQVLNIFDLFNYYDFWITNIQSLNFDKIGKPTFNHFAISPKVLHLRSLKDDTRNFLIDYYSKIEIPNNKKLFNSVINVLKKPYYGDENFTNLVQFIKERDKTREEKLLDIEPKFGILNKWA